MARMTNFRSAAIATGNAINDSAYDTIKKASDNMDSIKAVNNNEANINSLVTNIPSVNSLAANINSLVADKANINVVSDNIQSVVLVSNNIGLVVALSSNYDEIKAANEQAALGVMQSINITANVIGVSTTIGPDQNAVSFGDITIAPGIIITIEDNSSWLII